MSDEKRTLLIVDDEPSCREAFCVALEDDYTLIEAETGEQALEILQSREDIGLVLLDYLLPPGIDGLEVLERMRGLGCDVPVIVITGKGSEEVCRSAFKMGVKNYIQKPFKVEELRAIIKRVCGLPEVIKPQVDRAIAFMQEHYSQPISASAVAEAINVSYDHLAHVFQVNKGVSLNHWLNRLRIDKARILLRESNLQIKEVAVKTGFNDQNYFCRLFRKYTGRSPQKYKQQSKQQ